MTELIWSPEAKDDYWKNIDYLLAKWTEKEATHFIKLVNHNLDLIQKNPKLFQETDYQDIRRAVILPQITLFYKVATRNTVYLLRFWNSSQDPKTLNL